MEKKMDRRTFLTHLGTGVAALAAASAGLGTLDGKANAATSADHMFGFKTNKVSGYFEPIGHTTKDDLVLPKGFKYDVVAAYGDVINKKGDTFGYNNDFTVYFPIDGSNERGLLWVNHEYTSELWVTGAKTDGKFSKAQVEKLLYNQGGSVIEVYRDAKGVWKMDTSSKYARRVTGMTPIKLVGPAAGTKAVNGATTVQGTFANCSGGMTLWNTLLSCEENFESTAKDAGLDSAHYGWVVEVDPFDDKRDIVKHTALGRFNHENTAMGLSKDGRVVVYMGDDKKDAGVYKFITSGKYDPAKGKENSKLLYEGTLYVADLKKGKWIAVTIEALKKAMNAPNWKPKSGTAEEWKAKFQTQADVLVNCHEVAMALGGTPTDRPEDIEISPFDNTFFVCHTNNDLHGNIHGHITRFFEKDNDLGAMEFDFEIFAAGGRQSGFSAPDNITFDSNGDLWTVTDISSSSLNKGVHTPFGNNGVYVIPSSGPAKGQALQFASAPVEAELTGPWFTPDERTLFLAVQHPGEETEDAAKPTSKWPHRPGDNQPRPAVVAITGFAF
ncbi:PhoX family protein [Paenibacillus thermotolerans]|uniref:PhoX family protein n=1 Tax=Paenibacillus thermotolerans TaxID=3027807 RepID=UPI0023678713|nr:MULTISPECIES: alkaline phosphatase PhoX [unclassified Paenibacillus]